MKEVKMFQKDEVVKMLKESVCTVKFTKKDGSLRIMKATLKDDVVKPLMESNGTSTSSRRSNPNQVCVIDTELNAWRSFNLDSLVSIE